MELKKLVLENIHTELGAKMLPFAGYNMPIRYSSDIVEHQTVRNDVGVFDVSHMGEFIVSGSKALALLQWVTSNDVSVLSPGKIQYACFPNFEGGIVDDLLVYQLEEEKYLLVVNASNIEKDWNWIVKANEQFGAELRNISDDYCLFAVQGPKAVSVVQKLSTTDLSSVSYYTFVYAQIQGIDEKLLFSATGYTGAGGFEVLIPNQYAIAFWNLLFEAGKEENIQPIGLGARDTLRLEKGYCLYGNDITDSTSPIEAGLGWITKFNKEFVNSKNLKKQKEEGVDKKLIGFKILEKGIARSHYPICDTDGNPIGEVTSGTISPSLNIGIGMGYVQIGFAKVGSNIQIEVRNKLIQAEVVKLPFL